MQQQKKITYTAEPLWVMLTVVAALLCVGVIYYWSSTSNKNKTQIARLDSGIKTNRTAVNNLTGSYSNQKAEQAREEADKIRSSMMSGQAADSLISGLRPTWSVVSRSEEATAEFFKRRYQIARGSAPVSVWPEVQSLIDRMKELDSLALDAIEVQTVGDSRKREFSRISLMLTIYVKKPE